MATYRNFILAALILAFGVVSLGAYVRLSDAGLGCPDWPGCYGKPTPYHAVDAINAELAVRPDGPVSHAKAWKEMAHRYFAGALGLLVLAIAVLGWRGRRETNGSPGLPVALLGLIVFQALLGMWTVTLLLKPLIVSAHLLGAWPRCPCWCGCGCANAAASATPILHGSTICAAARRSGWPWWRCKSRWAAG